MRLFLSDYVVLLRYHRGKGPVKGENRVLVRAPCMECLITVEGIPNMQGGRSTARSEMRKANMHGELGTRVSRAVGRPRGHDEEI